MFKEQAAKCPLLSFQLYTIYSSTYNRNPPSLMSPSGSILEREESPWVLVSVFCDKKNSSDLDSLVLAPEEEGEISFSNSIESMTVEYISADVKSEKPAFY